jgi:hypothetical protein
MEENKPEVKEVKTPCFDFMVDGMSEENANLLLDIICCFAESHKSSVVGGLTMMTEDELSKEIGEL